MPIADEYIRDGADEGVVADIADASRAAGGQRVERGSPSTQADPPAARESAPS